jgi:DNA-binding NarL/FixJ family response regulator
MSTLQPQRHAVLITDDHRPMRTFLAKWLSREFSSIDIHETGTAEEAIDLINSTPIDLVLMDFFLPGINGIDATAWIKTHFPETTVVILTMQHGEEYEIQAQAAGADAFIPKQTMYIKLLSLISALIHPPSEAESLHTHAAESNHAGASP